MPFKNKEDYDRWRKENKERINEIHRKNYHKRKEEGRLKPKILTIEQKEKQKETVKIWRQKNLNRLEEAAAKWREENKEHRLAIGKIWYKNNKDRKKKAGDTWKEMNKEHYKTKNREWRLKTKYGITLEEYNALLQRQEYKCAICGDKPTEKATWNVDHDHNTGKVRGILCNTCNTGIGLLKDDVIILANAIRYINKDKEQIQG